VTWHHWRKVSRLEDQVGWARPLAWSRAQRRHTARWWHRQRDVPQGVRATLDALNTLSLTQRKVLLLATLTAQPLEGIAAEVGLSQAAVERELQAASAQFSLAREVASASVRPMIALLGSEIASARWPRATILLRAGTTRRRSHTVLGIAAGVAATVLAGSLVTDTDGIRPDLASKAISSIAQPSRPAPPQPPAPALAGESMLSPETLASVVPGAWTAGSTTRNTEGDGLYVTCQESRYADPQGVGVLVRTFTAPVGGTQRARRATGKPAVVVPARTAVQSVEASATVEAAKAAYDLERQWYAACSTPRLQLISTHRVAGLGDAATLVVLRASADPSSTMVVGVARTGELTTTVATTTPGSATPAVAKSAVLLERAVTQLCASPAGGACVSEPRVQEIPPVALDTSPAMIAELDLPSVGTVTQPWAATEPVAAATNDAATRCDKADFDRPAFQNARTRSFLVPGDTTLPPEFGLTETVGSLPPAGAKKFIADVRSQLQSCPERDLGTQVTQVDQSDDARRSMTAWTVRVEIAEDRFVNYRMAIMRSGTAVAQLGFIAGPGADLSDASFRDLAIRAMQRLRNLPAHTR